MKQSMAWKRIPQWLVLACAGGSLFSGCDIGLRRAFIDGTKQVFFTNVLDPNLYIPLLFPEETIDLTELGLE